MQIDFVGEVEWDWDKEGVRLFAVADGTKVTCFVSQNFLTSPLVKPSDEALAMELFQKQHATIDSLLRAKIENEDAEPDGVFALLGPAGRI